MPEVVDPSVKSVRARRDDLDSYVRLAIFTADAEQEARFVVPTMSGYAVARKQETGAGCYRVTPDGSVWYLPDSTKAHRAMAGENVQATCNLIGHTGWCPAHAARTALSWSRRGRAPVMTRASSARLPTCCVHGRAAWLDTSRCWRTWRGNSKP